MNKLTEITCLKTGEPVLARNQFREPPPSTPPTLPPLLNTPSSAPKPGLASGLQAQVGCSKALARFMSLHPHNISQKTEVIIEHFRKYTAHKIGGRAKAMLVNGPPLTSTSTRQRPPSPAAT